MSDSFVFDGVSSDSGAGASELGLDEDAWHSQILLDIHSLAEHVLVCDLFEERRGLFKATRSVFA